MNRKPRLCQPLFSKKYGDKYHSCEQVPPLADIVRAYDCIWTLVYEPMDITTDNKWLNAQANLSNLGNVIEQLLGEDVFETDPRQLSLDIPNQQPSDEAHKQGETNDK